MLALSLQLTDRDVLIVGGGRVATHRAERLLGAGARVVVVAARLQTDRLLELERSGEVHVWAARWEQVDHSQLPSGLALVCACTDDEATNEAVAAFASSRGVFVNRSDSGDDSDFHFAGEAVVGQLKATIATGGAAPVVSRALRVVLEESILPAWSRRVEEVAAVRSRVLAIPEGRRRRFWRSARERLIETQGNDEGFGAFMSELLEKLSADE